MQLAPQPSKSVFRVGHGGSKDEPVFFWRPYSNLPARSVLNSLTWEHAGDKPRDVHALFLGCTDPRTIVKSLAMFELGKGCQQLQLTAVVNDVHVPTLARTTLLLLMAAELDPNSKADMRLLFDVWFNTIWHADTWPRFAAFTQRLLDGSVPWLMPVRHQDQQQLQEVWRWWLDEKHPKRPTPAVLGRNRSAYNKRNPAQGMYKQPSHFFQFTHDKYPAGFRSAVKIPHYTVIELLADTLVDPNTYRVNYESTAPTTPHVEQARVALCAVLEGVTQHLETGSLSWDEKMREAQSSTHSSNVNITFVDPGTGAWNVHPDQQPFTCWGTYTAEELTTAMQAGLTSATVLADVFITRMASFIQRFQTATAFGTNVTNSSSSSSAQKPVALQVQLACGEGLGLCLHQLQESSASFGPDAVTSTQQHFPANQAGAVTMPAHGGISGLLSSDGCGSIIFDSNAAPFRTFDVIDTGSLCDDVGLLPLLVAVTPRLSNHPAARLHTVPATWTVAAPRMDYYLQEQALGMPLTMTATLLGLRLVTDVTYGRPTALRTLVVDAAAYDPRELAWQPVPPSQPRPRLLLPDLTASHKDQCAYKDVQWGPAGSIGAVLQAVCRLCCTNNHHTLPQKYTDVAVHLSTPHTLAWLLASCIPRLDMSSLVAAQQQAACTNSQNVQTTNAAAAHSALWALRSRVSALLPAHFRLAFQGAIDAVRASLQAATGSAEAAGVPDCKHQSFLMLPTSGLHHGQLAVAADVRLRRPHIRALLGASANTALYTFRLERVTKQQPVIMGPGQFVPRFQIPGNHVDNVYEFAYEGSPLDPAPRNKAVCNMMFPGAKLAVEEELKVHVLDCCSAPYSKTSGWRAAFMVPSDHASMDLPEEASMLVLVGPDYFGTHPLKHKFMDIPIQAVSPVLAQCFLHPLLHAPTTPAAAASSHGSPFLKVMHMDETAWGYEVVLKLKDPWSANAIATYMPQATTAGQHPSIAGSAVAPALLCASSHVVKFQLEQPADTMTQLVLGWPVAVGLGEPEGVSLFTFQGQEPSRACKDYQAGQGKSIKHQEYMHLLPSLLSRKAADWCGVVCLYVYVGVVDNAYSSAGGTKSTFDRFEGVLKVSLAKAQVWERWPEDRAPPPIRCQPLAPHLRTVALMYTQVAMYSTAGSFTSGQNVLQSILSHERNPRNPLRSFIVHMMSILTTSQRYRMFLVCDEDSEGETVQERLSLYVLVANELQVDIEDGHRFVVPALVIDLDLWRGLCRQNLPGFDKDEYLLQGLPRAVKACVDLDQMSAHGRPADDRTIFEDPTEEINIIRRYLWHNAQRWQPNEWQQQVLSHVQVPPGPRGPYIMPCYATCITPMYSEHLQQFHHTDQVFSELLPAGIPLLGQPLPYPFTAPAAVTPTSSESGSEASSPRGVDIEAGSISAATTSPARAARGVGNNRQAAGSQQELQGLDSQSWVCEKMSELRVDFSDCTDEELRSMAEMAYSMCTRGA